MQLEAKLDRRAEADRGERRLFGSKFIPQKGGAMEQASARESGLEIPRA